MTPRPAVRAVPAGLGLRLVGPPVALAALAFAVLAVAGAIAPLVAALAFAVLAAALAALLLPLAANFSALARWLAGRAEGDDASPALRAGPARGAIAALATAIGGLLDARGAHIARLTAETDRLLDGLPYPLLVLGRDRQLLRLNRAAARPLFGDRPASDLLGRDLAHALRDPVLDEAVGRVLAGAAGASVELAIADGRVERLFAVDVAPLEGAGDGASPGAAGAVGGNAPTVMVTLHDITAIRRTEELRVDFVANASHEIRSPLTALIGCIETLRGPAWDDDEARATFLEMMDDQGRRMARLVDDLLSLSRIELKEHTQPTDKVDLAAMLERLRVSLRFDAAEKEMAIALDMASGLAPARGDEGELEQALYNLVSNAIRYGRRGTAVSVCAGVSESPPDHLRLSSGPLLWVAVSDDGEGIEPHHLPRLTERFYRVDAARSRALSGTGLGLAIVKHVLNRHRGELHIESRVGEGSTFTVWLPTWG